MTTGESGKRRKQQQRARCSSLPRSTHIHTQVDPDLPDGLVAEPDWANPGPRSRESEQSVAARAQRRPTAPTSNLGGDRLEQQQLWSNGDTALALEEGLAPPASSSSSAAAAAAAAADSAAGPDRSSRDTNPNLYTVGGFARQHQQQHVHFAGTRENPIMSQLNDMGNDRDAGGNLQPPTTSNPLARQKSEDTLNLSDYHYSEYFSREELETQAVRRKSSGSLHPIKSGGAIRGMLLGADAGAAGGVTEGSLHSLTDELGLGVSGPDGSSSMKDMAYLHAQSGGNSNNADADISPRRSSTQDQLTDNEDELEEYVLAGGSAHRHHQGRSSTTCTSGMARGTLDDALAATASDRRPRSSRRRSSTGSAVADRRDWSHSSTDVHSASENSVHTSSCDSSSRRQRRRRSSIAHPDEPKKQQQQQLHHSNSTFEVADLSTDDDTSSRPRRGRRRHSHGPPGTTRCVSGHSLASMMLLVPNMDDYSESGNRKSNTAEATADSFHRHQGEGNKRRGGRRSRSRDRSDIHRAWGSNGIVVPPPPGGHEVGQDLGSRWNEVAETANEQWTDNSFRYKRSRSLSPYSRGLVGNLPPGNLDPNASGRVSELSDNDTTSHLPSSDETNSAMKKTKKKPKADVKIRQGGLKGLWLVLPKQLRKRSSDVSADAGNKDKDNDGEASLSPSVATRGAGHPGDIERGRGMATSKSKRGIKTELHESKRSLTGMGKLGDSMVMGRDVRRRRKFVFRCCLVLIFLILALIIPILLSVPGFVEVLPPRLAEVVHDVIHRVQDGISYVTMSMRTHEPERDILGRTISSIGVEIDEPMDDVRARTPPSLRNLMDVDLDLDLADDGRRAMLQTVNPFLWDLDHSGSHVVEKVFADCVGRRVASDLGGSDEAQMYARESQLRVVNINGGMSYLNVNLQTTYGIERAQSLALVSSGQADITVSPMLFYAAHKLYDVVNKGRLVCILRHPVERELANYHNLVQKRSVLVRGITGLEQYAETFGMQENYMVRMLSGHEQGINPATPRMLEIAKDVVRTKCLVGLHEQLAASINRIVKYLDLESEIDAPPSARPCIDNVEYMEEEATSNLPPVKEGDPVYETILRRNSLDAELYNFALGVFEEQGHTLFDDQQRPIRMLL